MKKYQIIYADPPWSMRYATGLKDGFHCKDMPYSQMSIKEIKELPVKNLADTDCILFLWCIDAYIPKVEEIMEAWGFKYISVGFVWNKVTPNGGVNALVSQYTRKSCELCFIGRKGKMLVKNPCSVDQYVGDVKKEHSKKPEVVRERIVKLCGDLPRVELFARPNVDKNLWNKSSMDGWDVWGNEVESDIKL
jgi:N6-adenosine-specific RNA methylase IME4